MSLEALAQEVPAKPYTNALTIHILGKPYTVNYLSETQSCGTLGSASRAKQVINLNVEANGPAQLEDTLLHEVLHIIDEELKVGLSEEDVARLAVGLYSAGYRRIPA